MTDQRGTGFTSEAFAEKCTWHRVALSPVLVSSILAP